jgi:hypothetical protein
LEIPVPKREEDQGVYTYGDSEGGGLPGLYWRGNTYGEASPGEGDPIQGSYSAFSRDEWCVEVWENCPSSHNVEQFKFVLQIVLMIKLLSIYIRR